MKALSLDLRQRIVTALEAGHPRADIAARFAVSESSLYRIWRQWRAHRDLAPKKRPGRGKALKDEDLGALETLLAEQTDPTGASLVAAWQESTGKRVGLSTMHRALRRLNRSFKKVPPRRRTRRRGARSVPARDSRPRPQRSGLPGRGGVFPGAVAALRLGQTRRASGRIGARAPGQEPVGTGSH